MLTEYGSQLCLKKLVGQAEGVDRISEGTWLGLGTAKDTTGITEISGGGYARVQVVDTSWGMANAREIVNTVRVDFLAATAAWPTVHAYGLFNAETGGNCLCTGTVDPAYIISTGQIVYALPGQLSQALNVVQADSGISNTFATWLLKWLFGIIAQTAPNLYVGITPDALENAASITGEVFLGGYDRKSIAAFSNVSLVLGKASAGNTTDLLWDVTASWPVDSFQVFLASHATDTDITSLIFLATISPISAIAGDKIKYLTDDLKITLE